MSIRNISWIDKGSDISCIAHKIHSNAKLTTPIRDILIHENHLCLAKSDGSIQIRKRDTGKIIRTLKFTTRKLGSPKRVFCNTLIIHNGLIWGGYSDGFVRGWTINGKLKYERSGHRSAVKQLVVSGDKLYSHDDQSKLLERGPVGSVLREFELNNKWIRGIVAVPRTNQLWMVHHDGVYIWQNDSLIEILHGHDAPVLSISKPWNGRIWTGDKDGVICMWDMTTFSLLRRIKYGSRPVMSFCAINKEFMLVINDGTSEGLLIAALNTDGNLIKFLYPLPDNDRFDKTPNTWRKRVNQKFTLYSAASLQAMEQQKVRIGNERYVLSQMVMDHQQGRLWMAFKNPLCLQSYNLYPGTCGGNTSATGSRMVNQQKMNSLKSNGVSNQSNRSTHSQCVRPKIEILSNSPYCQPTPTELISPPPPPTTMTNQAINDMKSNNSKFVASDNIFDFNTGIGNKHSIDLNPDSVSTVKAMANFEDPRLPRVPQPVDVPMSTDTLNVNTAAGVAIQSAKSMVLSPSSIGVHKERLLEFAEVLNVQSVKLSEDRKQFAKQEEALKEQRLILQNELKDIQRRTDQFEAMMKDQKSKIDDKKSYESRIGKLQQNLISTRIEMTKYKESCHHQTKRLKALEHGKSMMEFQLKTALNQLSEMKAAKIKRGASIQKVTEMVNSNHRKELEYVAALEEKTTKLVVTEEKYSEVKVENDALKAQNTDLIKQVDQLLGLSNSAKEKMDSLQRDARDGEDQRHQLDEFMLSLFDHCYRCNDDVKPPPMNELRCFAQKSSAILSWLERHENKVSERAVLHEEALNQWQRRSERAENEAEDLRTRTNSLKEHSTKLEHDLILLSSNEEEMRKQLIETSTESKELRQFKKEYERMVVQHAEMLSDNKAMSREIGSLRMRFQSVSTELEEKSSTLQRLLDRFKVLQIEQNESSSAQKQRDIQLKQYEVELRERIEDGEATHLNYIRIKMEQSQLKQEYDRLKADFLAMKTRLNEAERIRNELEKQNNFMKENTEELRHQSVIYENALNKMGKSNREALSEANQRIHGLQNENSILMEMAEANNSVIC